MIAEDSDDNRTALKLMLELHGYRVIEAVDGEEAVMRAHEDRPDIILMDISLPVLDGIAATDRIRRDPACANIPIIVISAYESDTIREESTRAGSTDYCSKPIDFDRLKSLIEHHLEAFPEDPGRADC
ncbi:MAG: response regulator [Acidobacteriota bacterium]|nr:MAG: response regulator [Acidobacteriota bacterium]